MSDRRVTWETLDGIKMHGLLNEVWPLPYTPGAFSLVATGCYPEPCVPATSTPYESSANCERPHTDVVPLRARLIGLYRLGYDATDETLYSTAEKAWKGVHRATQDAYAQGARIAVRNAELTRRANELGDECGDLANELARSQDEVRDLLVENARLRRSMRQ